MENSKNSIGIFDSGVGGLTVFKEIEKVLPDENLIYFGDTAHVPYGSKSKETVEEKESEEGLKKKVPAPIMSFSSLHRWQSSWERRVKKTPSVQSSTLLCACGAQ